MVFNITAEECIISNTPLITLCDSELSVKFAHTSSSLWGLQVCTQHGQGCAGGDVCGRRAPVGPAPPAARGTHGGRWLAGGSSQPGLLPAPSRTQPRFWECSAPNLRPCPGQLLAPRIAQISCGGSNNCPRDGKRQLFPASWEHCWTGRAGRGAAECGHPPRRESWQLVMLFQGLVLSKKRKGFQRGFKPQTCFFETIFQTQRLQFHIRKT